jgi:hypothetical protein
MLQARFEIIDLLRHLREIPIDVALRNAAILDESLQNI